MREEKGMARVSMSECVNEFACGKEDTHKNKIKRHTKGREERMKINGRQV